MLEVKRTLVKSGPELWAEVADPAAMARHLSPFGSVRITHAEPERLVEWEGECARGAVRLEPSGFGTRVILTAERLAVEPPPAAGAEPEAEARPEAEAPEPAPAAAEAGTEAVVAEPAPVAPAPRGVWARLFRRRAAVAPAGTEPQAEPDPEPEPEPAAVAPPPPPRIEPPEAAPKPRALIREDQVLAVLTETLDALGTAHHRPFSRA